MATVSNKKQMQSYIMTTAKYDFSVYEKRIIYHLVSMAQHVLEGRKMANSCIKIQHELWGLVDIEMPISAMLVDEKDKNHKRVKEALHSLSEKYFIYEDDEVWQKINIVVFPNVQKRRDTIKFVIHPKIWDCMLNFSKGYRAYELEKAMSFKSAYAMRFYELFSEKTEPITYTIEYLKDIFGIQNKYKNRPQDFKKNVLLTAQKELNEKSPYTFTFEPVKKGRKITAFKFYPVYQAQFEDENLKAKELQKQVHLSRLGFSTLERRYLREIFGFSKREIDNNITTFTALKKYYSDLLPVFDKIKIEVDKRRGEINKPKAYIISILKQILTDKFDQKQMKIDFEQTDEKMQQMTSSLADKFKVK